MNGLSIPGGILIVYFGLLAAGHSPVPAGMGSVGGLRGVRTLVTVTIHRHGFPDNRLSVALANRSPHRDIQYSNSWCLAKGCVVFFRDTRENRARFKCRIEIFATGCATRAW